MSRKKILLVDDSPTVLLMEQMLLGKTSYELVVAKDGEEGVKRAREERPDLILMDIVMPNVDGLEACRRLRADPSTSATPIIMVTTRGEMRFVEDGYRSGCSDYVTKPIDGHELLSKVRSLLGE